jgi:hypothetical protein
MRFVCLVTVLAAASCGGGGSDDGSKAKMAGDLVDCKNQVASLKEQLNDAKAALAKAEELAGMVVKLDPIDIKAVAGMQVHHMEGNVKPDMVVKVVKQNSGGLRACYEKALKRKPDLQYVNNVTAKFQIKNSGNAMNVHFAPHTDAEMEQCMASTMEKWKFPSFEGDPVSFEQPVNLVAK